MTGPWWRVAPDMLLAELNADIARAMEPTFAFHRAIRAYRERQLDEERTFRLRPTAYEGITPVAFEIVRCPPREVRH